MLQSDYTMCYRGGNLALQGKTTCYIMYIHQPNPTCFRRNDGYFGWRGNSNKHFRSPINQPGG